MTDDVRAGTPPLVLVVMGVSGSGKSTVAGILAGKLSWDLAEGDDLHPPANVAKMHSGTPLTDEDRWPWLEKVGAWIREHVATKTPGIITCSALKRVYRDMLGGPGVVFVHLAGSRESIDERLGKRLNHFMPESLLGSQFATLEDLEPDEDGIVIDIGGTPREEANEIIRRLRLTPSDATATLRTLPH
ncbi:gluconokinase [Microbacterium gorillae]|uniref:gluconokinase n=1 Tax=Microbacterium gorillae TaxID=1231063 RepID=UPI0005911273|nr:gluconokinase [Microbacterium gorillae]